MFKLIGENTLTGNTWVCQDGIATQEEANELRAGYKRLESDYKIDYYVTEAK
ncbi:hypothetical protein SEA_NANCIA_33 [Arthrobacter phage Nancia]|uniref:Uncharacterized protein n=8 Tax=Korravirus drrobert TaxID=1982078 RepID=A0A222ZGH5_9CAUD|nr:hypothetical protein SEA_PITADOG_33 [Arthrobacter phage PitaDog]AZF98289.1 hypothetical protein SEA_BODACIOUS_33 [Arthrobacter phage Bodacious]AZS07016.1 hypothetical protein SEA_CHEWCHEW_33 [Arthrobacter phage ChewChew]AZS07241.1 hypothetical protein SEA_CRISTINAYANG_33 [Arthrobacter phage CristinaYang]AZS08529.1 hypothetical protein SEA_LASAGNA_32 [Arthrobacter phage Lasagna]AZS09120.1 hypothetical protein SEA_NANCIA_33 [Arthrobacter phage Nancia]AZS09239.1 hypothetical protein SEA_OURGI